MAISSYLPSTKSSTTRRAMGVTSAKRGRVPSWAKCAATGMPVRLSASRPLRPTVITSTSRLPASARRVIQRSTERMALAFSEPTSPRSVVMTTRPMRRTGLRASSGSTSSVITAASRPSTSRS
jgi:hypothetical protein